MTEPRLTDQDFAADDYIQLRPALIRKMGGDLEAAAILSRLRYRCRAQRPSADGFRWWKTSAAELAEDIGISHDRSKRKLKSLLDDGWIVSKVDNDSTWDRTRSYRPDDVRKNVSAGRAHCADLHNALGESAQSTVQIRPVDGADLHFPLPTKEVKEEEQEKKPRARRAGSTSPAVIAVAEQHFQEWYNAYPRHTKPLAARKAYEKALGVLAADPRVTSGEMTAVDLLLCAAHSFAQQRQGEDPKYTPHPASWLNDGQWDDRRPAPFTAPAPRGGLVEHNGMQLTPRNVENMSLIERMRALQDGQSANTQMMIGA